MIKLLIVSVPLLCIGCGGTGFNKRITLVPDAVSVQMDCHPHDIHKINELTGTITWKFKEIKETSRE